MAQLYENNSNYVKGFIQSKRNIRAVLYGRLYTVKTRKSLATKFRISRCEPDFIPYLAYRKM